MTLSSLANDLSPVHVFSFRGSRFAFFVRTGDLMEVSEPAAFALGLIEKGHSLQECRLKLPEHFNGQLLEDVLKDLGILDEVGLLMPEVRLLSTEVLTDIEHLLKHQPRNLMLFVTKACNLKCTYCYEKNQGVHDNPSSLKLIDARDIIDRYFASAPDRGSITITFFGGEPLLNPKVIRETVAYAKQKAAQVGKNVGFTMTTNLTLLTQEMSDFLARERFHVMVSIDGNKEQHDRHRVDINGAGTYDTVTQNLRVLIRSMRDAGTRLPKLRATLTSANFNVIDVEKHLQSLGTPLVEIGESHGRAFGHEAFDVGSSTEHYDTMFRAFEDNMTRALSGLEKDPSRMPDVGRSVLKALRRIHDEVSRENPHIAVRPTLCGTCRNMKAVTPDGGLYPCHRYVGMEAFRFGTVATGLDQEKVRGYYHQI